MPLGGLCSISKQLYEAARIDAANRWNIVWNVTLPCMIPVFILVYVLVEKGFVQVCVLKTHAFACG